MVLIFILVALTIAALAIGVVIAYNRLIADRNHVTESWSNIDTELKRRHELIPNLVSTVKGYATHERELMEQVTALRERARSNNGAPADKAADEGMLQRALGQLMVRLEAYPDLKANTNFLELQRELAETENRIQSARRLFNGNVRSYNNRIGMVPTNIIARQMNFREATYFELDDPASRGPVDVSF